MTVCHLEAQGIFEKNPLYILPMRQHLPNPVRHIYAIKQHKELREKYKGSNDADFVFITSEDESPLSAYNDFVKEQELEHTYRLNANDFRYLRQLFRFNGIPKYIIVDREGRIWKDDANSYNFEQDLSEMLELEKTN